MEEWCEGGVIELWIGNSLGEMMLVEIVQRGMEDLYLLKRLLRY